MRDLPQRDEPMGGSQAGRPDMLHLRQGPWPGPILHPTTAAATATTKSGTRCGIRSKVTVDILAWPVDIACRGGGWTRDRRQVLDHRKRTPHRLQRRPALHLEGDPGLLHLQGVVRLRGEGALEQAESRKLQLRRLTAGGRPARRNDLPPTRKGTGPRPTPQSVRGCARPGTRRVDY